MKICNSGNCLLLVAAALCAGCGKQERIEAVQFAKVLTEKKSNFAAADALEKDLVSSARAWCGGITANGAGRGVELDQNAAVAAELAKSTVAASTQLSQVRQAVDGQVLKEEYTRSVRNPLITQLTRRQRLLQDMRALLEQSGTQFVEYRQSRAYAGDTYPDGIGRLDVLLRAYKAPEDALGAALGALKAKYSLSDSEL
ncbi:MAG TPA: hypothetical protein VKU19_04225 [Bryobacteraceae bacterium]|nr:hypothetical protein [Bryobacteraceae bacterium]